MKNSNASINVPSQRTLTYYEDTKKERYRYRWIIKYWYWYFKLFISYMLVTYECICKLYICKRMLSTELKRPFLSLNYECLFPLFNFLVLLYALPHPISSPVTMSLFIIPVVCILKVLVLLNNKRFVVRNTNINSFWQGNHLRLIIFEKKPHHELFPSFCAVHQVQLLLKKGMKKLPKYFHNYIYLPLERDLTLNFDRLIFSLPQQHFVPSVIWWSWKFKKLAVPPPFHIKMQQKIKIILVDSTTP